MAKQLTATISEFPPPNSEVAEIQAIADIVSMPETLADAERILDADMFRNDKCRKAYEILRAMAKEGVVIDRTTVFTRMNREFVTRAVFPTMNNSDNTPMSAIHHFSALKEIDIKLKCYDYAVRALMDASNSAKSANEIIGDAESFAESLGKERSEDRGTQHISEVLQEVGDMIGELQRDREAGKMLRVPTGFGTLNFYTYGGFNAGNLVILAARPSVGKTAVMLQMAKAAASSGKAANIYSLEMTNAELAQRFLLSESSRLDQWSMARGDIEWQAFEQTTGVLSSKPIYLNDSARTIQEITSKITLNAMAGKCDIAFIDYLGLIKLDSRAGNLSQAIAECTKDLKALAKALKIPIVLLCQLNRSSASEKRPPEMHDLRDSGGIEQDADIVLMLERASEDERGKDVNMWVRKNRQGSAGNLSIVITANDSFTSFVEKRDESLQPPYSPQPMETTVQSSLDFDNSDFPF